MMRTHEDMIGELGAILGKPEVRQLQVDMLASNILNLVDTTRSLLLQDEHYKEINMPYNVYDWKMGPFESRMRADHKDYLHLEHPRTLGVLKNLTDLDNLEELLRMILTDRERSLEVMEGCHNLLSIKEDLIRSHLLNQTICNTLSSKYERLDRKGKAELQAKIDEVHANFDRVMDEGVVLIPVQHRYRHNAQLVFFGSIERELRQKEQMIKDATTQYHQKIQRDNNVMKEAMKHYVMDIEELKNKLTYWSWKYDNDYEHVSNRVAYNELTLKAMRKQWDECLERQQFFRSERRRFAEEDRRQSSEELRVSMAPAVVKGTGKRGRQRAKK